MSLMRDFGLLGNLSINQKRELIKELRGEILADRESMKAYKVFIKEKTAQDKALKVQDSIEKAKARLQKLLDKQNPVGAKAIKSNKKAGAVTVTKVA